MCNTVQNDKRDVCTYEWSDYKHEIYDGNKLYDAFLKAKKNSSWKARTHQFQMNLLFELSHIQQELKDQTYELKESVDFVLNERGKIRAIKGDQIQDRIVKHVICDEVLMPAIKDKLIYDDGASIKDKGIDFTRNRLTTHLQRFYRESQSNEGYILLIDFTKYFDNIRHDVFMDLIKKYVDDERSLWLIGLILEKARIDVSYMNEDEYADCMNAVFNSLEYNNINKDLLTGDKYMSKHLDIGDQVSQIAGVLVPLRLDNYIKIVQGNKYYGRYMDDSYIIHKSKEYLERLLIDIVKIAEEMGITVNMKKTRICKLSDTFVFLQNRYTLTSTGKVVVKISKKRLTRMRRKMKKMPDQVSRKEFENWYKSWFNNAYKIMSKQQRKNLNALYEELLNTRYNNQDCDAKKDHDPLILPYYFRE